MKKIFLFLFIFSAFSANAQIIEFEDNYFKQQLLNASPSNQIAKDLNGNFTKIDLNNNNEIEVTEAENISYLKIQSTYITSAQELNYFKNIEDLTFRISQTTELSLNGLQHLKTLNLEQNELTELSVMGSPLLEDLKINENKIASLNIEYPQSLISLNCNKNKLTDLEIGNYTNLEELYCSENLLTSLIFYFHFCQFHNKKAFVRDE